MSFIKKALRKNRFTARLLNIYFLNRFYLEPKGWTESRFTGQSIDGNNEPIPWFSYACIHFISARILPAKKLTVYEYGMGNSTKWFAQRAKHVVSVDHDKSYFEYISPIIAKIKNAKAFLEEDTNNGYIKHLQQQETAFDIIVIDGRNRNACAPVALSKLTSRGVIIWDNSDRPEYQPGIQKILDAGFRKIDFHGHSPISFEETMTSIYYKEGNCLDI
ncbi:FkbM family methyltransferase [Persicobacter psychrovividus]|uniref:Class I SAM-dependent methyltransferase n=1 Tax=Persicobacter psychrovividus TaxID=387638 RepID=A0ABM7VAA3_9BACT|nr:hypothetical protein PEPS_01300 [Persicobacter psychrovividus]